MDQPITLKFKSFEAMVLYFNGMYKLPISNIPTLSKEAAYQFDRGLKGSVYELVAQRVETFFSKILKDEIEEHKEVLDLLDDADVEDIDSLVALADLLGDIMVFCASEMARYGIPQKEVLEIIMQSNFSKLGADGQPIYDETGKVKKGPFYWKPEPQIKQLLLSLQKGE